MSKIYINEKAREWGRVGGIKFNRTLITPTFFVESIFRTLPNVDFMEVLTSLSGHLCSTLKTAILVKRQEGKRVDHQSLA